MAASDHLQKDIDNMLFDLASHVQPDYFQLLNNILSNLESSNVDQKQIYETLEEIEGFFLRQQENVANILQSIKEGGVSTEEAFSFGDRLLFVINCIDELKKSCKAISTSRMNEKNLKDTRKLINKVTEVLDHVEKLHELMNLFLDALPNLIDRDRKTLLERFAKFTPTEIMALPLEERQTLLTLAATDAEEEYTTNKDLTDFEAFDHHGHYDETR